MEMKDVLADKAVMDEIRSKVESDEGLPKSKEWNIGNDTLRAVLADETSSSEMLETRPYTEAIILEFGRPALLIKNDTFEIPNSDIWKARLYPTKSKVEKAIKSVGRIELLDHPSYEWVGTGWMITENIIVTNRHVALEFAEKRGKSFVFSLNPGGKAIRARIDFKEEYKQNAVFETELEKVLFIEKMGGKYPDLAFLQLKKTNQLPSPISLSTSKRSNGDLVAVIGYPARDHRSDFDAMVKVFGDIYDVKRLAPGTVTSFGEDLIFTHDCSTLGGNSGSAVVDIDADGDSNSNGASIVPNPEQDTITSPTSLSFFRSFLQSSANNNNTLTVTSMDSRLKQKFSSKFGKIRKRIVYKNGECNLHSTNVSKRRRRYLADIYTTLVDIQWRWTLLSFTMSFIVSWLSFAVVWWIIAFRHGDFEPEHLPDQQEASGKCALCVQ